MYSMHKKAEAGGYLDPLCAIARPLFQKGEGEID